MAKNKADKEPADDLGLKGPGVEIPRIKELDEAAAEYQKIKKKRCEMTPKEVAAKDILLACIKKHADKLPVDDEGTISYRNDKLSVVMKHSKESLKVKDLDDEEDDDQD